MAGVVYNNFKEQLMLGTINLTGQTWNAALLTNAYTPDIDTHQYWAQISSNEVTGTGYSAGGQALGTKSVTQNNTDDRGEFDAGDVTWSSSTITARYWVIYKTGTASTNDYLMGYENMGADKSSSNGDFKIAWNSLGILHIT